MATKEWTKKNNEWLGKMRRQVRVEAVEAYGGRCVCCGEDQFEFLTFDHKDADGAEHRKDIKMYFPIWLKRNNWPDSIQLMCWNCNCAKNTYDHCPHKTTVVGRSW